jgi:hypothetical protein
MNDPAWKRTSSESARRVAEYVASRAAKAARKATAPPEEDRSREARLVSDFLNVIDSSPVAGLGDVRQMILAKNEEDQIGSAEASRLLALIDARRTQGE